MSTLGATCPRSMTMNKQLTFPMDEAEISEMIAVITETISVDPAFVCDVTMRGLAAGFVQEMTKNGLNDAVIMGSLAAALQLGYALGVNKAERARLEDLFS